MINIFSCKIILDCGIGHVPELGMKSILTPFWLELKHNCVASMKLVISVSGLYS